MKSTLLLSVVALLSMAENVMPKHVDPTPVDPTPVDPSSVKPKSCDECFRDIRLRQNLKKHSGPVKCFVKSDGEFVGCGVHYRGATRCTKNENGAICVVPDQVDPTPVDSSSVVPTPVDSSSVVPTPVEPKSCVECLRLNPRIPSFYKMYLPKFKCYVNSDGDFLRCDRHYPGATTCTKNENGTICVVPDYVDPSSVDPTPVDSSSVDPTPVDLDPLPVGSEFPTHFPGIVEGPGNLSPWEISSLENLEQPKSCAECAKEDFCLLDIQNGDFVQCGPCEDCYCTEIACSDGGNSCNTCWNIRSLLEIHPSFKPKGFGPLPKGLPSFKPKGFGPLPKGLPSFLRKGKVPKDELLK